MGNVEVPQQADLVARLGLLLEELASLLAGRSGEGPADGILESLAWGLRLPSVGLPLLNTIFSEMPGLEELFDFHEAVTRLCTADNLEHLRNGKIDAVRDRFGAYFDASTAKAFRVFFPCSALDFRDFEAFSDRLGQFEVRLLTKEELAAVGKLHEPDLARQWQFVVDVRAKDHAAASRTARSVLTRAVTPYYIHRALQRDQWWRAHVERRVVSSRALWMCLQDTRCGVAWNLEGAKGSARELFLPSLPIEGDWHRAVAAYLSPGAYGVTPLNSPLALCAEWIGGAEWEDDRDTAIVKYNVAWEALFPHAEESDSMLAVFLLIACVGAEDPLCVRTTGQALRLRDRRHSYSHPRIAPDRLWGSPEQNLAVLRQSVRRALDAMMELEERMAPQYGTAWSWSEVLVAARGALLTDRRRFPDGVVGTALTSLLLADAQGELTAAGFRARTETLLDESRRQRKSPAEAVRLATRSLLISRRQEIRESQIFAIRCLLRWLELIGFSEVARAWAGIPGAGTCPTADVLSRELTHVESLAGLSFSAVGWADTDLPKP